MKANTATDFCKEKEKIFNKYLKKCSNPNCIEDKKETDIRIKYKDNEAICKTCNGFGYLIVDVSEMELFKLPKSEKAFVKSAKKFLKSIKTEKAKNHTISANCFQNQ